MRRLHRQDLFCWSAFDERRDIDFNSVVWIRPEGNVLIDPLAMSPHDFAHLRSLGGATWIAITNSDHVRAAATIASELGAKVAGPAGERETFPIACERWLRTGDELVAGLRAIELAGSKTPDELAFLLEGTTLVTGDLVRAHRAGALMLLPPEKLSDVAQARASVAALLQHREIETVLVGDGWHVFGNGRRALEELAFTFQGGANG